ncbi:MAG: hypothetical protein GY791_11380 [Alphaproteobacteria bacterium]|nr:hypothetical protein [Alphaproteobacteria bacterium]
MRVLHSLAHTAVPLPMMASAIARYGMPRRARRGIEEALVGRVLKPRYRAMEARLDNGDGFFFRVYVPSRFYLARANLHAHNVLQATGIGVAERLGCGFLRHHGQTYFIIADKACAGTLWRDRAGSKALAATIGTEMAHLHRSPVSSFNGSSLVAHPPVQDILEQKLAQVAEFPDDLRDRMRADIAVFRDAEIAGPWALCQTDPTARNFIARIDRKPIWIDLDTIRVAQIWNALCGLLMTGKPYESGVIDALFTSYFAVLPDQAEPWRRARLPWLRLRLGTRLTRAVIGPEVPENNRWDSPEFCRALYDAASALSDDGGPESRLVTALHARAGTVTRKRAS